MAVRVAPFSTLPVDVISEYLVQQCDLPRELVQWKYFSYPNEGRERGFACVEGNRIVGVVGVIPFQVSIAGEPPIEAVWSCDWHSQSGVGGIILMQQLRRSYPLIYSLGGSDKTQKIMPRLSQYTSLDAGVELHKPLRLGGLIRAGAHFARVKSPGSIRLIDNLRIFRRRPACENSTDISSHVDSALKKLPALNHLWDPQPAYDMQYIEWLLARCPTLSVRVAGVPNLTDPQILTLFWTSQVDRRFWRMAVLGNTNMSKELTQAIDCIMAHIYGEGGWLLSILTSRFEDHLLRVLKRVGFVSAWRRRPLFILNRLTSVPSTELRRLSYLDTDYAYRFTI